MERTDLSERIAILETGDKHNSIYNKETRRMCEKKDTELLERIKKLESKKINGNGSKKDKITFVAILVFLVLISNALPIIRHIFNAMMEFRK